MTYRTNPSTGDKVSILGYGCMRLPTIEKEGEEGGDEIDQEMVNRQVDYALAHGLNTFDTSPAYLQRRSERAMGIAFEPPIRARVISLPRNFPISLRPRGAVKLRWSCTVTR